MGAELFGRKREITDWIDRLETGVAQDLAKSAWLVAQQIRSN
jgi:hypothetical protein